MLRTPDKIIDEQVQEWSRRERKPAAGKGPTRWPVITISREFGAHGAALAAHLGQRTGFSVWDKSLVQAIAQEGGADRKIMESLDERRRKTVEDAITSALMGTRHSNLQYLRSLMRVVTTIAEHGSSIVVGRGANYICAPEVILSVRLVCPLEQRVHDYVERKHVSEGRARREIERMDLDRTEFIRYNFKRQVAEPSDYDIVLNAGMFDTEVLGDLVMAAYQAKFNRVPTSAS